MAGMLGENDRMEVAPQALLTLLPHFTTFTSTKVQILTSVAAGAHFTCFTSTKAQMLTQVSLQRTPMRPQPPPPAAPQQLVLTLLALLVQKK